MYGMTISMASMVRVIAMRFYLVGVLPQKFFLVSVGLHPLPLPIQHRAWGVHFVISGSDRRKSLIYKAFVSWPVTVF